MEIARMEAEAIGADAVDAEAVDADAADAEGMDAMVADMAGTEAEDTNFFATDFHSLTLIKRAAMKVAALFAFSGSGRDTYSHLLLS
jgi:hypothetical protein